MKSWEKTQGTLLPESYGCTYSTYSTYIHTWPTDLLSTQLLCFALKPKESERWWGSLPPSSQRCHANQSRRYEGCPLAAVTPAVTALGGEGGQIQRREQRRANPPGPT